MNLDDFLHNLHFDIDKLTPADWDVDWDDAPLPYKLYRGLPQYPLSAEVPLELHAYDPPAEPDVNTIGSFLWYIYGLNQIAQLESDHVSLRRYVPSGGALYPNELYVYLKIEMMPVGVYHYDVARHRLVLLRDGNFDSYLERTIGGSVDVSKCFATVFISTMYWKNFFKYHNFSYRLQGLDSGVLIGQLEEVSKRFSFEPTVCFQFLDRAVNHLLGLSVKEETVYAVIPLSREDGGSKSEEKVTAVAEGLMQSLPILRTEQYVKSKTVHEAPMIVEMNEASRLDDTAEFRSFQTKRRSPGGDAVVRLPDADRRSADFSEVCRNRYSPGFDFLLGKMTATQLATLFRETTTSLSDQDVLSRLSLYVCLYHVEGIEDGAYNYDPQEHALRRIADGDHRAHLQDALSLDIVNLFQVPICLHIVGDRDHYKSVFGYRGYRIQQMEAGMLVQRILLAASALGMNGHPLLGFDVAACDTIYQFSSAGKTCLIQIPIGPHRQQGWLKGSLNG